MSTGKLTITANTMGPQGASVSSTDHGLTMVAPMVVAPVTVPQGGAVETPR